jgi:GNAT superfamily N-acetyltransferase
MTIQVVPFGEPHAPQAAQMFVRAFESLRRRVPALPGDLAEVDAVRQRLGRVTGVAALDDGRLVGYLAGRYPIAAFRRTDRVGAYVPEWAHGAEGPDRRGVYNAMYREASAAWSRAACTVHAITLLATDGEALETWAWSGFGMGVVDGIRAAEPLDPRPLAVDTVRRASMADASALAVLDLEHVRHYAGPPVFMPPPAAMDEAEWAAFLGRPGNAAWLAEDPAGPYAFIRFDVEFGGSAVTASPSGAFISGAYVRPSHRRRGAASAILDAAMCGYAADGVASCAVDFEAFNPEAARFWTRHFTSVCYSLMRVPETRGPGPVDRQEGCRGSS